MKSSRWTPLAAGAVAALASSVALAAPVVLEDGESAGAAPRSRVDLVAAVTTRQAGTQAGSTRVAGATPAAVVQAALEDPSSSSRRSSERETEVEFENEGGAAAVPLPPSLWLMTPVAALLLLRKRRGAIVGA